MGEKNSKVSIAPVIILPITAKLNEMEVKIYASPARSKMKPITTTAT